MSIQAATPYLILGGNARQAIALYERAFGAKTERVQRFGDFDQSCPAAQQDHIMHAELRFDGATIMLSDGATAGAAKATPGTLEARVNIALGSEDEAAARRSFEVLAEKGTVVEPLAMAPWGALFGIVADELGIGWMFNVVAK